MVLSPLLYGSSPSCRQPLRQHGDAPEEVKIRHISNCLKADPAYGKGVADALGIDLARAPR